MANDQRKPATSSLIPLEIDPTSILSLSKGIIFDTIVHNIEYTLNNQRTDPLPWKLIGMSLICDPNRNKRYMQKLQKMQCVPSVISTQIYHSKLIKTESGILATPGKKITLATTTHRRLTGIIVCRSIDELLYMESSNTENVHFIQYKLLSYERIATRELVNGPKLSSVRGKVIKTVFDFELTQNNGFPRQLLPVAIISFGRQDGCDLILSIRNFLKLDEHKTFDKSYLVTSINVDLDRLREEEERKEEEELENEITLEKLQQRQPLADLSRKTIDSDNDPRISKSGLRVPPLKIKIPNSDKTIKSPMINQYLDKKYQCFLKLDRIDLSMYDISNLPTSPPIIRSKTSMEDPVLSNLVNKKIKPVMIIKPYEHSKPLKRLNNSEMKKQSTSVTSESSKEKSLNNSTIVSSLTINLPTLLSKNKTKEKSISTTSMSPIYRSRPLENKTKQKISETKKKVQRPILPSAYHCSLILTPIDLSLYDIDLPSMNVESTTKSPSTSSYNSLLSESIQNPDGIQSRVSLMELETISECTEENIMQVETTSETNTHRILSHTIDEVGTPDLNGPESNIENDILSKITDEPSLMTIDEVQSISFNQTILEIINEIITQIINQIESSISNEESMLITTFSPDMPSLEDDPVLLSLEHPQISLNDDLNMTSQDYIIIVPCSDDEDDLDDYSISNVTNQIVEKDIDNTNLNILLSPQENNPCPSTLVNRSLTRILDNSNRINSPRLSTSSSSSCSSISTSIIPNQTYHSPLSLIQISLPQKILHKKQQKSFDSISFSRYDLKIPIDACESLIDPRLKYRLQPITIDTNSIICCTQCSMSPYLSSIFSSSTQTILFDRRHPFDFVDPRRESLKNAILYHIYQRIKLLIPNIFIINSIQFQKLLFEQTIFKSNCSLHLEYLLHKLKRSDETNFFQMMRSNEEFQLAPLVNQLIFSHS